MNDSTPLTPEEAFVLASFRKMDQRRQREQTAIMVELARLFPRRTKPALRLITEDDLCNHGMN